MTIPSTSVLIPSFRRAQKLGQCLQSLSKQTCPPDEVVVVWQADDTATRDLAEQVRNEANFPLRILHEPEAGVVPAENRALEAAASEIILLIDDDAIAPPDWVARHLSHYSDPTIGAVGGSAINFNPDGTQFPERAVEPIGKLTWYGRAIGNMYDLVPDWRTRPPLKVDHLAGGNLSLRRRAISRFEPALKPYWQMFEMEACLQVKAGGYRVIFDFSNVVEHRPTNTAFVFGRNGDIGIKVCNAAFNHAFVLGKHSPWYLSAVRLLYLLGLGTVSTPGLLLFPITVLQFGNLRREISLLGKSFRFHLEGWVAGVKHRRLL